MKRSRLKPMSDKRRKVNAKRKEALEAHFGPREGWRCWFTAHPGLFVAGGCFGELAGHEILKRSRAGSTDANLLDMANIVILCQRHNSWVEDEPQLAHGLGLAKHSWE